MRGIKLIATLVSIVALGAVPAAAMTLEEVIAKHVEAKGGDAWDGIRSMKITGAYTAFSETHDFTVHRTSDDKYRLEAGFLDSNMIVGYDGAAAWSDTGAGPEKVDGLDLAILQREADFTTPFFDYSVRGYEAELLGEVDFEGLPAIGIKLERGEESEETWYLDPKTYLEMGRLSPGSDWLGEVERTTYYDDFREVSGVMVPYYTQSQWYTRDRVFEIAEIEINAVFDDAVFDMPLPTGMGPLISLVGSWDVAMQQREQPGADWQESERTSTIDSHLRGGLLQERWETSQGVEVVRMYTYDKFSEKYRIAQIDGHRTMMDVKEGQLDDEGKLVVSNTETGTTWSGFGMVFHGRLSVYDIADDGFKVDYETSIDSGENWFVNAKATYTRSAEQ